MRKDTSDESRGAMLNVRLFLAISMAVALGALGTLSWIVFVPTIQTDLQQTSFALLVILVPILGYAYGARRAKDPRLALVYPGITLELSGALAISFGSSLGVLELVFSGLAVLFAGGVYLLWFARRALFKLPIEFVHPLLILASDGLESGVDHVVRMRFPLAPGSAESWRRYAQFIRSERIFARVRIGRTDITFWIGRIHPLPVSSALWPWWLLFGASRIHVAMEKSLDVRINKPTYELLDRPSPSSQYAANISSIVQSSFDAFTGGDAGGAKEILLPSRNAA
ncbi:MAG: hypothetical protein V3U70_03335 [Thermoplasmata archaeon]